MRKFLVYMIKRIILIAAFISAIAYCIIYTTTGLSLTVKLIGPLVPGKLTIETINGSFASNLQFTNFNYELDGVKILIAHADVRLDNRKLIERKLIFKSILADHINITIPSAQKTVTSNIESEPTQNSYDWLNNIVLQKLELTHISLIKRNKTLYIDEIRQNKQDDYNHIYIRLLDGDIDSNIKINWQKLAWELKTKIRHINPAKFAADWKGNINFDLQSSGQWEGERNLHLNVSEINGSLHSFPLSGHINLDYTNQQLQIKESKLAIADAYAEMSGNFEKNWHLRWKVNIPSLATIVPESRGLVLSEGKIVGAIQQPKIEANIKLNNFVWNNIQIQQVNGNFTTRLMEKNSKLNLLIKKFKIADYEIPTATVRAVTEVQQTKLSSNFKINFNDLNQAIGHIEIPDIVNANLEQKIDANIHVNFKDIKDILVAPFIANPAGILLGEINVSGQLKSPVIRANAQIQDGKVQIPSYGLALQKINLQAKYTDNQLVTFSGHFISGTGQGQVNGQLDMYKDGYPLNINLTGKDLTVMNTAEYKIKATPEISLAYSKYDVSLKGSVFVPKVTIRAKENNNITTLPSEVVFVNRKNTEAQTVPADLAINLTITLGDNVKISYGDLKTMLQGKIVLTQNKGSLPIANGEFHTVKGRYKAYGKLLKIKLGRLIYTGNSITDPGLDIRAEQTFKSVALETGDSKFNDPTKLGAVYHGSSKITVGILVKGTLNKPYLTLYSDPAGMTQGDMLSYLVFGYPQANIKNAGSLSLLNQLASSMNASGGEKVPDVTKKIKKTLGLSDLSFGSTEYFDTENKKVNTATTVNIGKKLGKNLSIHYSVGLFNSLSILNLKYQINKRIAIQTETSTMDNGADIFYEFERD